MAKRKWDEWKHWRCCTCGRFCVPADEGVHYGNSRDVDPPEPDYFCPRCAKERMDMAMHEPEKVFVRGVWWIKPDYVRVAKSVLRHRKKEMTG